MNDSINFVRVDNLLVNVRHYENSLLNFVMSETKNGSNC